MSNLVNDQTTQNLEQDLSNLRQQARDACKTNGEFSSECATAWDIVEEIQAEIAHRRQNQFHTNFEQYCAQHPDASECRIYDV